MLLLGDSKNAKSTFLGAALGAAWVQIGCRILCKREKNSFLGLPPHALKALKIGKNKKPANFRLLVLLLLVARTGIEPVFHP